MSSWAVLPLKIVFGASVLKRGMHHYRCHFAAAPKTEAALAWKPDGERVALAIKLPNKQFTAGDRLAIRTVWHIAGVNSWVWFRMPDSDLVYGSAVKTKVFSRRTYLVDAKMLDAFEGFLEQPDHASSWLGSKLAADSAGLPSLAGKFLEIFSGKQGSPRSDEARRYATALALRVLDRSTGAISVDGRVWTAWPGPPEMGFADI